MKFYILERQTEDWDKVTDRDIMERVGLRLSEPISSSSWQRSKKFLTELERWDEIFSMSYTQYRSELKKLARQSWEATGLPVVSIDNYPKGKHDILLPTDDDDWFAPAIETELEQAFWGDVGNVVRWGGMRLDLVKGLIEGPFEELPYPLSNSYAVRGIVPLKQIDWHTAIEDVKDVKQVDSRLSIKIEHWGSMGGMWDRPISCAQSFPIVEDPHWAIPLYRRLVDINTALCTPPAPFKTRTAVINHLIRRFKYDSYLELGWGKGENFHGVHCAHKVCVDDQPGRGTITMKTDDYFECQNEKFDLIFIDASRKAPQVYKDFENALKALNPRGCIVLNDCLPETEEAQLPDVQTGIWTGDVWKAMLRIRKRKDVNAFTLDTSRGLGIVFKQQNTDQVKSTDEPNWHNYLEHKNSWLRVTPRSLLPSLPIS